MTLLPHHDGRRRERVGAPITPHNPGRTGMTLREHRDYLRNQLKARRRELGLSQEDVAGRICTHKQQVQRWEAGTIDPSLPSLILWAAALGCIVQIRRERP
jgi:DNA-binding transcriptional regulator YiaG